MSNKKNVPVAGKTVAGKNNYNKKKDAQRKKAEAEKNAKRLIEEKRKKQKQREKRSEEIRRQRQKISAKETRTAERKAKLLHKRRKARFVKKIRYYTSKRFLSSLNYFRIFTCIILPISLIITASICISQSVLVNVPADIRAAEFNGRVESETVSGDSIFNVQQQQVFVDAIKSKGSRKFSFYFNSVVNVGDDFSTDDLCFGNPKTNDFVLIATVYDKDNTVLYRSLGLEPGKEINRAKLFGEMSYGIHDVKVAVNAYDKNTNKKIGTRYAKIKIAVGVEYNGEE